MPLKSVVAFLWEEICIRIVTDVLWDELPPCVEDVLAERVLQEELRNE